MSQVKKINIFSSYYEAIRDLDPDVRLELYDAIFQYAFDGTEPEIKNVVAKAVWIVMRPNLRNSVVKTINGGRGGAPKGNFNAAKNNQETTEEQPKNNQETTKPQCHPLLYNKDKDNKDKDKDNNYNNNSLPFQIDYEKVVQLWNEICSKDLGKILKLSESRKRKIKERVTEIRKGGEDYLETLRQIFAKVIESDFCIGKNDRGWKANFDWLFENDKNYIKVLEGRYANQTQTQDYGSRHLQERSTEAGFWQNQDQLARDFLKSSNG